MKLFTPSWFARNADQEISIADAVTNTLLDKCHVSGPNLFEASIAEYIGLQTQLLYEAGHLDDEALAQLIPIYRMEW